MKTVTVERSFGGPIILYSGASLVILGVEVRGGSMTIHLMPEEACKLAALLMQAASVVGSPEEANLDAVKS